MAPYVPKTIYSNFSKINEPQTTIMKFIDWWVHEKKTPTPLKQIIAAVEKQGINKNTIIYSLKILIEKRYIRRAYTISNKTFFVQLRGI